MRRKMVSKQHCPVCGFLMMYEVQDGEVTYTCVNNEHSTTGKAGGVYLSDNLVEGFKGLGNNVDLLLQYLKRP
jgi:hypothetical protein